jgi:hypothetical protein
MSETKRPRIKPNYIRRCKNYLLWLGDPKEGGLYVPDRSIPDESKEEFSAVEAAFLKETHNQEVKCSQPYLLDCLKKGKASREFHIKGWLSMTRTGEAVPEEFFGCLGLRSTEEFRGIFGHPPTLPRLRIIQQELTRSIESYEGMLKSSGSGETSSPVFSKKIVR